MRTTGDEQGLSPDEVRHVVGRVFNEVWNRGLVEVLDEVFEPEFVGHGAADAVVTKQQLKERVAQRRIETPDLHYRVHRYIVEGQWAATLWTGTGTPDPGTGSGEIELLRLSGITVWRLRAGRVAEAWVLGDEGARGWSFESKPDGS